jgi:biopolymer transport protein ExbB
MDLQKKFLAFALLGATWVLWVLVALSVVSIAIMVERIILFVRAHADADAILADVRRGVTVDELRRRHPSPGSMALAVAVAGARERPRGAAAAAEAMAAARVAARAELERNLAFLGTLGNNAPFIGLFGTVLGIIKAFNDLAANSQAGAEAVMSGISEALVATAIGLLVAIPAVIAFNTLNRRVRAQTTAADKVAHEILADLRAVAAPTGQGS